MELKEKTRLIKQANFYTTQSARESWMRAMGTLHRGVWGANTRAKTAAWFTVYVSHIKKKASWIPETGNRQADGMREESIKEGAAPKPRGNQGVVLFLLEGSLRVGRRGT